MTGIPIPRGARYLCFCICVFALLKQAHILDKQISVSCGTGVQKIKWLGHVAIARWDEQELQGWKKLGRVRTRLERKRGGVVVG